jgi:hypothetical protein
MCPLTARTGSVANDHSKCKQVTQLERCQCCKARIQRHHIGYAFLVWLRLKHGLLEDYLIQQLKNPSLKMILA